MCMKMQDTSCVFLDHAIVFFNAGQVAALSPVFCSPMEYWQGTGTRPLTQASKPLLEMILSLALFK